MRQLMPHLIHVEQKDFIPGRSPHHHVCFLSDLQHLLYETGADGIAEFLDLSNTYDRVDLHVSRALSDRFRIPFLILD